MLHVIGNVLNGRGVTLDEYGEEVHLVKTLYQRSFPWRVLYVFRSAP